MTMFAQITTMRCNPDKLDEFAGLYAKQVIPITRTQIGYRGLYLLLDHGSGTMVTLSLWDSEEDATVHERGVGFQGQLSKLAGYLATAPNREGYEVSVDA